MTLPTIILWIALASCPGAPQRPECWRGFSEFSDADLCEAAAERSGKFTMCLPQGWHPKLGAYPPRWQDKAMWGESGARRET